MKPLTILTLALAFGSHAVAALAAGTPINELRDVAADAHISISNVKGEVKVTAWDRNQVQITGTLGEGAKRLAVEGGARDLSIKVEGPEKSGWFSWGSDTRMGPTVLDVRVPHGVALDVDVVSAPLSVSGLAGGKVGVNTVSGRVRLDARSPLVSVDSVSGDVELDAPVQRADVETVSGNVVIPSVSESADVQTVSGGIRVNGGPLRKGEASTVSGDIELGVRLAADATLHVETMSGDVRLDLPADLSAQLSAETFSGNLQSDFGSTERPEHGPGTHLDTRVGTGAGRVTVETFSGDIHIRKGGG